MIKLKSFKSTYISHPLKIYQSNLTIRDPDINLYLIIFYKKVNLKGKEERRRRKQRNFMTIDELEAFFILDS